MKDLSERRSRADRANALIGFIATRGRKFFGHKRESAFEVDDRGRVWFIDGHSGRRIYTHTPTYGRWRGFSEGGTLRDLVCHLRDYIRSATTLPPSVLGPWPDWVCGGDLWGYGDEMANVRDYAAELEIIQRAGGSPLPGDGR